MWLVAMFLSIASGYGQEQGTSLWLKSFEELAEEYELEEYDWEEELQALDGLQATPIDLNRTTREELRQLPFLSDAQIENIQAYIYLHGEMNSLNSLISFPPFFSPSGFLLILFPLLCRFSESPLCYYHNRN